MSSDYDFYSDWDDEQESRYDDHPYDEDDEDEFVLFCGVEGCLMPGEHFRSECHTIEHVKAYERYHNPTWWQRVYDRALEMWHGVVRQPRAAWIRWRDRKLCKSCGKCPCDEFCDGLPF
jgi:hypothetical protein